MNPINIYNSENNNNFSIETTKINYSYHSKMIGKAYLVNDVLYTAIDFDLLKYPNVTPTPVSAFPSVNWLTDNLTAKEIFYKNSFDGKAISPIYKNNYRNDDNVIDCQYFIFDIDESTLLPNEIIKTDFYNNYILGINPSSNYQLSERDGRCEYHNKLTEKVSLKSIDLTKYNKTAIHIHAVTEIPINKENIKPFKKGFAKLLKDNLNLIVDAATLSTSGFIFGTYINKEYYEIAKVNTDFIDVLKQNTFFNDNKNAYITIDKIQEIIQIGIKEIELDKQKDSNKRKIKNGNVSEELIEQQFTNDDHNEMLKLINKHTQIRNLKQTNKNGVYEKLIWAINLVNCDFDLYEKFFNLTSSPNPTESAKAFRKKAIKALNDNSIDRTNQYEWFRAEYEKCYDIEQTTNNIFNTAKISDTNIDILTRDMFVTAFENSRLGLLIADTGLGKNRIHKNRTDTIILTSLKNIVSQNQSNNDVKDIFNFDENNTFTYDQSFNILTMLNTNDSLFDDVEYLIIDEFHNFYTSGYRIRAIRDTIKLINWVLKNTKVKIVCQTATFFDNFCDASLFDINHEFDVIKRFNKIDKPTIDYYFSDIVLSNKHYKDLCNKVDFFIQNDAKVIIFYNDSLGLAKIQSELNKHENISSLLITTKDKKRNDTLNKITEYGVIPDNVNVILTTSNIQEGVSFINESWEYQTIISIGNNIESIIQIAGRFRKNKHTDIIHFRKSGNDYRVLNSMKIFGFDDNTALLKSHIQHNKLKYYYLKHEYIAKNINTIFGINHKHELVFEESDVTYDNNIVNKGIIELSIIFREFLLDNMFNVIYTTTNKRIKGCLNLFFDTELGIPLNEFIKKYPNEYLIIKERFERKITKNFINTIIKNQYNTKDEIMNLYDDLFKGLTQPRNIKNQIKKEKQENVNASFKESLISIINDYKNKKLFKEQQIELCNKILYEYSNELKRNNVDCLTKNDILYSYVKDNKTIEFNDNRFKIINQKTFKCPTLLKTILDFYEINYNLIQNRSKSSNTNKLERYLMLTL